MTSCGSRRSRSSRSRFHNSGFPNPGEMGKGKSSMLHIPILRHGKPYESIDKVEILHHATGEPVARVSQANAGLISRDVGRIDDTILEQFTVNELLAICKKAAALFM